MVLAMNGFAISVVYVQVHAHIHVHVHLDGAHLSFLEGEITLKQLAMRQQGKIHTPVLFFSVMLTITHPKKCCY